MIGRLGRLRAVVTKEGLMMDNVKYYPDSKVHGANMGPIWGRQDPGGPHVGPMNFVIWVKCHIGGVEEI